MLTRSSLFFASDHFYIIKCTEVRNIEFISKRACQFFVFKICHSSSSLHLSTPLLHTGNFFFFKIATTDLYLLLPLKWKAHRTFFDIPRRFELSEVDYGGRAFSQKRCPDLCCDFEKEAEKNNFSSKIREIF